ncbi:DsbA family oxidoreductase [Vibrio sp. TH_r3]|uniref:DsbA family oxidoreductase n=1 Tax=Vibrio sp. TH_r3 TaxID=3082084 RepID=UPI002952B7D1|nr:DsbA family oxidoreductase [Vibrio sp. TH_r3]MDV7103733.1 DsbA family oxidoreductase [Vibrio sp. TH_r3]
MKNKIKLDIVSDVVCPWCIVGYNHLQAAINELGIQDRIEIEWQPFELNPDMPPEGEELRAHVARKYGSSAEDSARARENITAQGAKHGFEFNYFDGMKIVNTFEAHILLEYAKEMNKQTELKLRLFSAFFTEKKDVSDREVLLKELASIGLNDTEARKRLDDPSCQNEVRTNQQFWTQAGISSVPTVVFDRTSALSGAHPVDTFKQVLTELMQQE